MKRILKHINFLPKEIIAVEAIALSDNNWVFHSLQLLKDKNSIDFNTPISSGNIEELVSAIKPNTPVSLIVNGKGIINRKISSKENESEEKLLQMVFPGAKTNDFYTNIFPFSENTYSVSVARRSVVDNLIKLFSDNKIIVVDLKIGFSHVNTIIPILSKSDNILVNGFNLKIEDDVIIDFEIENDIEKEVLYKIENSEISFKMLSAFAAGFMYLLNLNNDENADNLLVAANKEEQYYSNVFKKFGWSVLIFFFSILLINFFLFDFINKKHQNISSKVSEYNYLLAKHDTLNKDFEEKKVFLENVGFFSTTKISFYADRLVSEMPNNIKLTELNIFPLKEKQQKEKDIEFVKNTIIVVGSTSNGTYLNDWVNTIKKYKWIEEVSLDGFNQENLNSSATFNLKIKLR